MKLLPKITLGVVTILSLCSCGKGRKTTRENFLEKVSELDINFSFTKAEMVYTTSLTKGKGRNKENEKNTYSAYFVKDGDNWNFDDNKDKKINDILVLFLFTTPIGCADEMYCNYYFKNQNVDVTYYINPFGIEFSHEDITEYNTGKCFSTLYYFYQWDTNGYLTHFETRHEEKKSGDNNYYYLSVAKAKFTYK